jgi:uncharacterized protein YbgA (DUF1722 family)
MARDPERYKEIGPSLAGRVDVISMCDLADELVHKLRRRPPSGRLMNALQHLWGYVNRFAQPDESILLAEPGTLIATIRDLATQHTVLYLLNSTALSDLDTWIATFSSEPRGTPGGDEQ